MPKKRTVLFGKPVNKKSKTAQDLKYLNTSGRSHEIIGTLAMAVKNGSEWYIGGLQFFVDPVGSRWVVSKLKEACSRESKVGIRLDDSKKLLSMRIV